MGAYIDFARRAESRRITDAGVGSAAAQRRQAADVSARAGPELRSVKPFTTVFGREVLSVSGLELTGAGARLQLPIAIPANLGYRFYAHHLRDYYTCDWMTGALPSPAAVAP